MAAARRGDWETMTRYFAADSTWTLMPPGTTFRGPTEVVAFLPRAQRAELAGRDHLAPDNSGHPEQVARELRPFFAG